MTTQNSTQVYGIRIVYIDSVGSSRITDITGKQLPTVQRELVFVPATSLQEARNHAMRYNKIPACGRFVRFYDMDHNEIFGSSC